MLEPTGQMSDLRPVQAHQCKRGASLCANPACDAYLRQALFHPYFTAMPYPSHPSKLPKPAKKGSTLPLEEFDGNVDFEGAGPGVRANPPNKLKRKLSAEELGSRPLARRLDFSQHA